MSKKKSKAECEPRKEVKLKTQQSRFLYVLWNLNGGIEAAARKIKLSAQVLNNWKLRGKIPLEKCGVVARALGIKIWALNYEELVLLLGNLAPSWRDALNAHHIPKSELSYIYEATPPKDKRSILGTSSE